MCEEVMSNERVDMRAGHRQRDIVCPVRQTGVCGSTGTLRGIKHRKRIRKYKQHPPG